jgi:hypothetical protein
LAHPEVPAVWTYRITRASGVAAPIESSTPVRAIVGIGATA